MRISISVMEFFIVKMETMRLAAVWRPLKRVRENGENGGTNGETNVTRPTSSLRVETVGGS